MKTFNEYLAMVNHAIDAIKYPEQPAGLYQPIAYHMALGGKRLRPVLVLMAADAMGGNLDEALMPAVGLEMFHNFTLLHDDVMDRSPLRRGKPTVHTKWNDNTAILSGDAMLTMATQFIAMTPAHAQAQVMELFNKTAMEIYEGQQFDVDFEKRMDVTEDEYLNMIRLKTGVLLGCACKMGAIIAGASEEAAEELYLAGLNVGIAFQLQDDLIDVWGDEGKFGKPIGGDIVNNKKTALLIAALNKAQGDDATELRRWIEAENPNPQDKINAVRGIYNRLGLKQYCENKMLVFNAQASQHLTAAKLNSEGDQAFERLIYKLLYRDK